MRRRNNTGSVKWDKIIKKYRAIWHDEDGNRHSQSFSERIEAHEFLDQMNLDKRSGITVGSSRTLEEAVVELFRIDKQITPKYRKSTRTREVQSAKLLAPLSDKKLDKITADDITNLYNSMRQGRPPYKKKYAESTIKKVHLIVQQVFARATTGRHRLPYNPIADVKAPSVTHEEAAYYTKQELDRLFTAIHTIECNQHNGSKHNYHILFRLFLTSALRYGELVAIRWEDIDLNNRTIHIQRAWNKNLHEYTELKTAKSKRFIPILSDEVFSWLLANQHDSGLVFQSRYGFPMPYTNVRDTLKKALKIANIPVGKIHTFRHTGLSQIVAQSGRIEDAQRIAGHSEIATTSRYYHHILEQDTSDLLEKYKTA